MTISTWKSWLDPDKRPFRGGIGLGLVFALSWILAFPGISIWPLVIVGPWVLIRAGLRSSHLVRTALGVSLGSLPMWAWHHHFVVAISAVGLFPLVAYLSIWPGLFVWVFGRLHADRPKLPIWALAPVAWSGLEVLRGEVIGTGYPWFLVAHPIVPVGPLADYASVVGVYGVGAILLISIGWFFDFSAWEPGGDSANERRGKQLGRVAALGATLFFLGAALMWPDLRKERDVLVVSAVQTNIPQSNKIDWTFDQRRADFERFIELTRIGAEATKDELELGKPDLIVWPETMFPWNWLNPEAVAVERNAALAIDGIPTTMFHDALVGLQSELDIPMIVGAVAADGLRIGSDAEGRISFEQDALYNSALVIENGAVEPERYDKTHLMPFGEVMPYISLWPWLEKKLLAIGANGMSFDLDAGKSMAPLHINLPARGPREAQELAVATPICFEVTMGHVCREMVYARNGKRQARLMVNLTNDGWFMWHDGGREHHLLHARWRCIELGTPMIRAANTGISAIIGARGRVIASGPNLSESSQSARTDGVLWGQVSLPDRDRGTIYGRIGNIVGWGLLGVLGFMLTMSYFRPSTPRQSDTSKEAKAHKLPLVDNAKTKPDAASSDSTGDPDATKTTKPTE